MTFSPLGIALRNMASKILSKVSLLTQLKSRWSLLSWEVLKIMSSSCLSSGVFAYKGGVQSVFIAFMSPALTPVRRLRFFFACGGGCGRSNETLVLGLLLFGGLEADRLEGFSIELPEHAGLPGDHGGCSRAVVEKRQFAEDVAPRAGFHQLLLASTALEAIENASLNDVHHVAAVALLDEPRVRRHRLLLHCVDHHVEALLAVFFEHPAACKNFPDPISLLLGLRNHLLLEDLALVELPVGLRRDTAGPHSILRRGLKAGIISVGRVRRLLFLDSYLTRCTSLLESGLAGARLAQKVHSLVTAAPALHLDRNLPRLHRHRHFSGLASCGRFLSACRILLSILPVHLYTLAVLRRLLEPPNHEVDRVVWTLDDHILQQLLHLSQNVMAVKVTPHHQRCLQLLRWRAWPDFNRRRLLLHLHRTSLRLRFGRISVAYSKSEADLLSLLSLHNRNVVHGLILNHVEGMTSEQRHEVHPHGSTAHGAARESDRLVLLQQRVPAH
mmetsp:Transcript_23305/g.51465  ORF Transcript_23305/g.51465 Transcript_23305/m.51465 type:complete len:500 (+) Transcript_23305:2160-3659(+)